MRSRATPYLHLRNVLTADDIDFLRNACKRHLHEAHMPCYTMIDHLDAPTFSSIKALLEHALGERLYYLNDFYIYTDSSFKTNWHMDTELFTFHHAFNAWILLSPSSVDDPLGVMDQINWSPEHTFHSMRLEGDKCIFGNYCTGETTTRPLTAIEAGEIHTPKICLGDILVFNPRQFHRTNVSSPKHALAFKFLIKGERGFLSPQQVNPMFWPEVEIFNNQVKDMESWNDVLEGIRRTLMTDNGRKVLSAGFYPEKFELYRKMVAAM